MCRRGMFSWEIGRKGYVYIYSDRFIAFGFGRCYQRAAGIDWIGVDRFGFHCLFYGYRCYCRRSNDYHRIYSAVLALIGFRYLNVPDGCKKRPTFEVDKYRIVRY